MFKLKDLALRRYKKPVENEEDLINFIKLWWINKHTNTPTNINIL